MTEPDPSADPTRTSHGVTSPTGLFPIIEAWVVETLTGYPDLPVLWHASFMALPSESETDPDWVPAIVAYFELPITEDRVAYRTVILPPFAMTKGLVHATVAEAIGDLIERRNTFEELTSPDVPAKSSAIKSRSGGSGARD